MLRGNMEGRSRSLTLMVYVQASQLGAGISGRECRNLLPVEMTFNATSEGSVDDVREALMK